jgi:Regulator of chromosome condensation (RCC1) repeat
LIFRRPRWGLFDDFIGSFPCFIRGRQWTAVHGFRRARDHLFCDFDVDHAIHGILNVKRPRLGAQGGGRKSCNTNVVRIAAGLSHTVALKGDGTVVVWGWNNAGQTNVPPGLSGVAQIASGGNTVFAVTTNGTLVTWGDNSYSQRKPPAGLTGLQQFVLGLYHALGLKK